MEWNEKRNGTITVKSCYWFCSMHKFYKQVQHCPHASISKCGTVASWFSVVFESQTHTQKAKVWLHKTIVMEWEKKCNGTDQEAFFLTKEHLWSPWQRCCSATRHVLIKTSSSHWQMERSSDGRYSWSLTLLGKPKVTASNNPGVKRPQSVASAFLERCVSITAVN